MTVKTTTITGLTKPLPDNLLPITASAWVNFNGTGVVAINNSFNVSGITDNGVGDYTVNFLSALADTDYTAAFSGKASNSANGLVFNVEAPAVGSTQFTVLNGNNSFVAFDPADVSLTIFGGQS